MGQKVSMILDIRKFFETKLCILFIMKLHYKMRQLFYYKVWQSLLQNASAFSLQNATVLLQNATIIAKCEDFITKYDSYYKMRHLLQNVSAHTNLATIKQHSLITLISWFTIIFICCMVYICSTSCYTMLYFILLVILFFDVYCTPLKL